MDLSHAWAIGPGAHTLYDIPAYSSMAVHTAFRSIALGIAILGARPRLGMTAALISECMGGSDGAAESCRWQWSSPYCLAGCDGVVRQPACMARNSESPCARSPR